MKLVGEVFLTIGILIPNVFMGLVVLVEETDHWLVNWLVLNVFSMRLDGILLVAAFAATGIFCAIGACLEDNRWERRCVTFIASIGFMLTILIVMLLLHSAVFHVPFGTPG